MRAFIGANLTKIKYVRGIRSGIERNSNIFKFHCWFFAVFAFSSVKSVPIQKYNNPI